MEAQTLETIQIVQTPDVLSGKPRIKGHRISVLDVAYFYEYQAHKDIEKTVKRFMTLTEAEIFAALSYYYAHRDEIDAMIRDEEASDDPKNNPNVIHIAYEQATDPDYKLVLTPQEIAQEYGITASAVYQAVRRNTIPHRRSGSTILITRWDAEKRWRTPSKRGRPKKG